MFIVINYWCCLAMAVLTSRQLMHFSRLDPWQLTVSSLSLIIYIIISIRTSKLIVIRDLRARHQLVTE